MKVTKLTNLSKEPLEVLLFKAPSLGLTLPSTVAYIKAGEAVEVKGNINYVVDKNRMSDLRIDTYSV